MNFIQSIFIFSFNIYSKKKNETMKNLKPFESFDKITEKKRNDRGCFIGDFTIGYTDVVSSKVLDSEVDILIYVPEDAGMNPLPVIYLLDYDTHFSSVVGMVDIGYKSGTCPRMIVVGISSVDRVRDLTPNTAIWNIPGFKKQMFVDEKVGGGSGKFISFIEKELIPKIEKKYNTASYRMLIGHSLGGLLVLEALINHVDLFTSYVAIDPSTWWDNEKYLEKVKEEIPKINLSNKCFYLGIGNPGSGFDEIKKSILDLDSAFKKLKDDEFRYRSKYYGDDNHQSVPFPTIYDSIRFFFDFYKMKLSEKYLNTDSDTYLVNKYKDHFNMVSKKMGYTINPPVDENDGLIGFSKNLKQRGLNKAAESLMKFAKEIKQKKGKNLKS